MNEAWIKRSSVVEDQFGDEADTLETGKARRWSYFGGGGGGSQPSGQTTTVQKSDPWEGQQPYLNGSNGIFPTAQAFYTGGNTGFSSANAPQYYNGNTVAQLTPYQTQAINAEANLAQNNPVTNQANAATGKFLNGDYLSAQNPYFQNMAQSVMSSVVPGLERQFTQGNNMNQPGAAYAVANGATQALGNLAYQNYNDQINNQLKGVALAPQTQALNYQNVAALGDAGSQLQQQNQANINADVQKWNYNQQLPLQMFNQYANSVQGGYGSTNTLNQPYYQNQMANGLGGALGGGLLGGMIAPSLGLSNSQGALGGAGLGALLAFM